MSEKFSVSSNPYKGGTKISKPVNLPDSYSFDWSYQVKVTNSGSSESETTFEYKLSKAQS